jgi:hypothetical protein
LKLAVWSAIGDNPQGWWVHAVHLLPGRHCDLTALRTSRVAHILEELAGTLVAVCDKGLRDASDNRIVNPIPLATALRTVGAIMDKGEAQQALLAMTEFNKDIGHVRCVYGRHWLWRN